MRRSAWLPWLVIVAACSKPSPPPPAAPPEVYVATVVQKDVPEYLDLVGQTEGYQDVDIRARVEGFLQTVDFREGSFVRRGTLLYQIDPKPLQATLDAAKADRATADSRLTKTTNDGLVGVTQVQPGNLVGRGEATLLTTVSQINPILLTVGVAEADFLRVAKRFRGRVGSAPKAGGIELTLADGIKHPYLGRINVVERAVNPATGTIGVKLEFPNPKFVLRPGQYGRARLLIDTRKGALLVPQRAVQELLNLYSVAVVAPDNTIAFRNVTVGPRVGSLWVIEQGLKP